MRSVALSRLHTLGINLLLSSTSRNVLLVASQATVIIVDQQV